MIDSIICVRGYGCLRECVRQHDSGPYSLSQMLIEEPRDFRRCNSRKRSQRGRREDSADRRFGLDPESTTIR